MPTLKMSAPTAFSPQVPATPMQPCGSFLRVPASSHLNPKRSKAALLCVFALAAATARVPNQNPAPGSAASSQVDQLAAPRPGFSFPDKLTLTYAVDWRVFPAGTAVIHFQADNDRERMSATAVTSGAINLIFHVDDRFQSIFNRQTGCSYEFDKETVEGRRQVNATLRLDYVQSQALYDQKNMVNGQTKHVDAPLHGCLTDLLTGIFYAASQPMQLGHSFVIPVFDAQHPIPVTMKVEAREEVKTALGTFKTLRVHPTADAGVVKNRGDIWIWYSDDDRHLPVQMRARLFWGTITFRLTGNENK